MQHDDNNEYILTNHFNEVSSPGDARSNFFNSRSYQSNLKKHYSTTTSRTPLRLSEGASLSTNDNCHADSPMAHPTSSFFNLQTGTSIIHINSNSPVSSTVRETSDYIDKQWAILKEKMLPASRTKHHSKITTRVLPEFVEERCEVDFSFIDEPNGNEPDDNCADNIDQCKSKFNNNNVSTLTTKSINQSKDSSFSDTLGRTHIPEKLVSSFSNSPGISASDNEKRPHKFNLSKTATKKDFDQNPDCSKSILASMEKSPPHCAVPSPTFLGQNGRLSKSSLLVPSFRDEFLSPSSSVLNMHLGKNDLKKQESQEPVCSTHSHPRVLKFPLALEKNVVNIQTSVSVPQCEGKSTSSTDVITDRPSILDTQRCSSGKDASQGSLKLEGMKSKRYQEMMSRKTSKKKLKESNIITSNQVPDYKGYDPLEEIISFINKDLKESTNTLKTSKKSKKRIQRKYCLEDDLTNGDITFKDSSYLEAESDLDCKESVRNENAKNLRENLNASVSNDFEVQETKEASPTVIAPEGNGNEIEPIRVLSNSFSDYESFSVVKKKKKIKSKPISKSISSDSNKSVSSEVFQAGESDGGARNPDDDGQSNTTYLHFNGKDSTEQNIPCPTNSNEIEKFDEKVEASEDPHKPEDNRKESTPVVQPRSVEASPKRSWDTHEVTAVDVGNPHIDNPHIDKKDKESEKNVTHYFSSQDVRSRRSPFGLDEREYPPVGNNGGMLFFVRVPNNVETNKETSRIKRITRNSNQHLTLLKSESSFNLRNAQAFLNSTFQEVMNNKGYVIYRHKED